MKSKAYLIDMGTRMNMNMLPLASGLISSFAMADDVIKGEYDIDIQFIRRPIRELVNELKHPKIIGISLYVWNLKATLNYAKLIKALHPDVIIVAGGYSVPKDKERIKKFYLDNPYIDILVHGEGEITFSEILKSTIDNKDYSKIDGITYKGSSSGTGAEFVTTKKRGRIADLNQIPSPFLNGVFDMLINKYGSQITGTVWETNRGCPYSCSFCDWGYSDTNSIYKHDLNRLYEELKWISKNKIHWIFGADGNFGIFYKRDYQIAEWVSDLCKKTSCPKFFIINWLKNSHERIVNIAEILEKGGVTSNVTLSIQSLNSETLKAIKRKNIKSENYNQIKAELHKRKTPTVVELILGLPLESYETFVNGLEKIMTASLYNHFAIYICSILENTEMSKEYYREKYGIITKECPVGMSKTSFDTDFIETEEYIIGTATMPVDDWGKSYIYGYLATVLYNHRVCFYIMNYIKNELDLNYRLFVEFLLDEVQTNKDKYKIFNEGIQHIIKQKDNIIKGINCMCPIKDSESVFSPHEGCVAILLNEIDICYLELKDLLGKYFKKHGYVLDEEVLGDIVNYQKIVMPRMQKYSNNNFIFKTNIPCYFNSLVDNKQLPEIKKEQTRVEISQHRNNFNSFDEFAKNIVNFGHTLTLNDVNIVY